MIKTESEKQHPGIALAGIIRGRKISQRKIAKTIDFQYSQLNETLKGKRPINLKLAFKLEAALGLSAEYWLTEQLNYDIQEYKKALR